MSKRGWSQKTISLARTFLNHTINLVGTAHGHIPDQFTKVYITLYNTLATYIDDICSKDKEVFEALKS